MLIAGTVAIALVYTSDPIEATAYPIEETRLLSLKLSLQKDGRDDITEFFSLFILNLY
jgi:hypothetical protein